MLKYLILDKFERIFMLAVNANYYIDNQSSIADELLISLKKLFKDFISEKIINKQLENIKKDFIMITKETHRINAEVETIRDFIDAYYINDIIYDEKILNKYSSVLEKISLKVENILDILENAKTKVDNPIVNSLFNTFDELYSNIVNTNFLISQKISTAYFDSQSNITVLQEA